MLGWSGRRDRRGVLTLPNVSCSALRHDRPGVVGPVCSCFVPQPGRCSSPWPDVYGGPPGTRRQPAPGFYISDCVQIVVPLGLCARCSRSGRSSRGIWRRFCRHITRCALALLRFRQEVRGIRTTSVDTGTRTLGHRGLAAGSADAAAPRRSFHVANAAVGPRHRSCSHLEQWRVGPERRQLPEEQRLLRLVPNTSAGSLDGPCSFRRRAAVTAPIPAIPGYPSARRRPTRESRESSRRHADSPPRRWHCGWSASPVDLHQRCRRPTAQSLSASPNDLDCAVRRRGSAAADERSRASFGSDKDWRSASTATA